jgi:hypothetical protein
LTAECGNQLFVVSALLFDWILDDLHMFTIFSNSLTKVRIADRVNPFIVSRNNGSFKLTSIAGTMKQQLLYLVVYTDP